MTHHKIFCNKSFCYKIALTHIRNCQRYYKGHCSSIWAVKKENNEWNITPSVHATPIVLNILFVKKPNSIVTSINPSHTVLGVNLITQFKRISSTKKERFSYIFLNKTCLNHKFLFLIFDNNRCTFQNR